MNAEAIPLWLALLTQLGLGFGVYRANPKSRSNQTFLVLSLAVSAWLLTLQFAFNSVNPEQAAFWIRNSLATGILIVNGFNLLRLGILGRTASWLEILRSHVWFLVPSIVLIGFCYTRWFLLSAEIPTGQQAHELIPHPIYGPLFPAWAAFFGISTLWETFLYFRSVRKATGAEKIELQFVLIGGGVLILLAIAGLILLPFLPRAARVRLTPFRVVIFSLVIAYGIATRKMMDVGAFLRRLTAYTLLAAYLVSLYALVWWAAGHVVRTYLGWSDSVAHILAALILVLSMAPAQGVFQNFATKLFAGGALDFRATVSKAASILSSVTTLQDLLQRFAKTIAEAVRTDRVIILLSDRQGFAESQRAGEETSRPIFLAPDDPLIQYLQTYRAPIVLDELIRVRATPESAALIERMAKLQLGLVMGIFARDHLRGAMLLGPRPSGRIYGSVEQNALQVLCGQLAVAIDNAQLFTEVENARIYNETLLENLTTGVIAAGADQRVTVFNNEAGQVTGLNPREIIDHSLDRLPKGLRDILCDTLRTGDRQENSELVLPLGDHSTVVRASSSIFHGQQGEMLGALVVLTDITALKRLELQIRRSDRLASLGTLSAGMAHEIKNPLVSIKTFAQLLPERYQDSDFRETFSGLIVHEIDRIDSLVNQLLRFARPAKPLLRPMHAHEILEKTLRLVQHRLYQKEIKVIQKWNAPVDTIRADGDQMEQVFLNFFLNAMDAMKRGGELTVSTETRSGESLVTHLLPEDRERSEALHISIRDTGEGIKKEDIARVFDPFFTTKDFGTGLGLSVVHGIIEEHGGQIEVESGLAKGTSFHIFLPLVHFDQKVAAA